LVGGERERERRGGGGPFLGLDVSEEKVARVGVLGRVELKRRLAIAGFVAGAAGRLIPNLSPSGFAGETKTIAGCGLCDLV
jgi:hypothetical protein